MDRRDHPGNAPADRDATISHTPPAFRWTGRWDRVRAGFAHAFALPADVPLTEEQSALLARLAAVIRSRRMETPAILAIESSRPLGGLAANATHMLAPFLTGFVSADDLDAAAKLMQHPRAADELIARLDDGASPDEYRSP